ncbi:MAG: helix-turn-helix transcriptional regulator [Hyphomicrobium sp.]
MRTARDLDGVIGRNIRLRREARGLSQRGLAKVLGVTYQQVQKFESGRNRISAAQLYQLAVLFDCSTEGFFRSDHISVVALSADPLGADGHRSF